MRREDVILKSYNIFENFIAEVDITAYKNAFVYINFRNEVITGAILQHLFENHVAVAAPRVEDDHNAMSAYYITDAIDDLAIDAFGIRAPKRGLPLCRTEAIDIVITPGVSFDGRGNRIGFGRGYYDTFFHINRHALRVGLAYDYQVQRELITTPRDEPVDMIVTESQVIVTESRPGMVKSRNPKL